MKILIFFSFLYYYDFTIGRSHNQFVGVAIEIADIWPGIWPAS